MEKKNVKGKEYYYSDVVLKFEGEYLNGERNEKEYNDKDKLELEDEYGKKWNTRGYDKNGKMIYELI